ncbi:bifunctional lysylphosphatidylglycerol synthetase/lysine--tRNA ligase LysX [Amycolatopsis tucumanensis]|uniref:bifunctional lysylphosphatidylglycerol synthetase/lysine--tRNA ligase LysX n=1 Tax=Amycolatopsis tucumanensis TaxID=401106 RepID=UPI001F00CD2F|nr:bifunctional lysylphosphatidylglycerol synthetase/lysine--tRNA ligase LysX [Amycolatopsis tucumanensis]MCF6425454.1 bifunctional lysylphosphatidylglycerol synthetase/lysine--tRNA ligase LysX [Amycolatopsis tucumanensis]
MAPTPVSDPVIRRPVPRWRSKAGGVVATVVQLGAVASVALLVSGGNHDFYRWTVGLFSLINIPADANIFIALVLAVLGAALRRRKRAALNTLILFQVAGLLMDVAFQMVLLWAPHVLVLPRRAPEHLPATLWALTGAEIAAVALIALLLALRPAFPARLAPGAWKHALGVALAGFGATILLGWGLLAVFPGTLTGLGDAFAWAVNHATGELLQLRRLGVREGPAWIDALLDVGATLSAVATLWVFFRGVRGQQRRTDDDELRLRALLAEHGEDDSLGYFATRRDKSVVFDPSGRAAVTYRVLGGTSIASADPVGDPDAWPQAIGAWLAESRTYGWATGVLGASERGARAYVRAGLKALELGDEAVLDVRDFSLAGPQRRSVRQAARRIERAGYTARIRRHADIPRSEMDDLLAHAQRWRDARTERGFSMALSRLGDPADGRCVMVEAFDAQGNLRGLLSFVPWGRRGLSLDLMRRDREAENGLNEYLIVQLVRAAGELGVQRISLNFAMFRAVFAAGERIGAGPVLRAWRALLGLASRFFQLESLYRSNAKYGPDWEPRFLCYSSARRLGRIGLVAGALEGFLPAGVGAGRRAISSDAVDEAFLARLREIEAVRPQPRLVRRPEQVRVRIAKLGRLRESGIDPYPACFDRDTSLAAVRREFGGLPPDTHTGRKVRVAGRVTAIRDLGGVCFARIQDGDSHLQLVLGDDPLWRDGVDLGDHVGATGEVMTSRRGELSVMVSDWTVTAKCLHPLPDKRKGLTDPETRVRQRYLDLIVNPAAADMLRLRSAVVRSVRDGLQAGGFLEVETPMLQAVHGGANARPFVTHINAYDQRMYLRIAPELYLKRLCVAGVEKVFELNRNFRNEGVDATHNPEFTMLEAYQAYADYETMRGLARSLIQDAAVAACGAPVARRPDLGEVDLSGDWPVVGVYEAVSRALGETVTPGTSADDLRRWCRAAGVPADDGAGHGDLVGKAFEHLVEPATVEPTFYTDYPAETSPLTRPHRRDPRLAERWDLIAFGAEIGTAYTELTDPLEQRRRLEAQSLRAASGDIEAMELDEDFLLALEYGMPPTGGLGIGIDRLVMMLTGASIRQSLAFPFARPGPRP